MLTLVEEFLLIALDDETGKIQASQSFHYGLSGAILMELTSRGCLDYQNKKLIFLDQSDSGDKLLNDSLQYLREKNKGKARSLKHWVQTLGSHVNRKDIHISFINRLIEKGILKQEEAKFLFFFTKDVYPSTNSGKENAIRERVKNVVLSNSNEEVDERTITLIGLLKACSLEKDIFSKEEYKTARKKINEIMKNNPHGKAVSDTIQAMQAAIIASVGAAAAASSTSSS